MLYHSFSAKMSFFLIAEFRRYNFIFMLITESIADNPILFGITATLTLLLALACIIAVFAMGKKVLIGANAVFYIVMFALLIIRYNNQPSATANEVVTILTSDNEEFDKLSDTTMFYSWNVTNTNVFTFFKKNTTTTLPSEKYIYCGIGVLSHKDKQYTEEEYKKELKRKEARQPDYYPFP